MDLTGKVAFVTGSASGLGKGYAEKLLQKGANVYICDINQEMGSKTVLEFRETFGENRCAFSVLDVTNESQFDEVFQDAINVFGNVDIMVNNAGVMDERKWGHMIQTNLAGTIIGTKKAFEHMRKDKGGRGGRIINVSSKTGLEDFYLLPIYTGTKHAIRAFTTSMAGIECAVLCPDATTTGIQKDLSSKVDSHLTHRLKPSNYEMMTVDEVADALIYLLEQESINGAILLVKKQGASLQKMESVSIGPTWKPPSVTPTQQTSS